MLQCFVLFLYLVRCVLMFQANFQAIKNPENKHALLSLNLYIVLHLLHLV